MTATVTCRAPGVYGGVVEIVHRPNVGRARLALRRSFRPD